MQLVGGANTETEATNAVRDILEDDKAEMSVTADGRAAVNPSAEPTQSSRGAIPTRRVGKVNADIGSKVIVKVLGTPPRRRAASVFGTIGREIVIYPASATTSAPIDATVIKDQPVKLLKTGVQDNATLDVQERESNESEALGDDHEANDDSSTENGTERRMYVRFKELADDTSAAYIHVLMGLFADNPGTDVVTLVFERANEIVEIAAPNGVDYNEVSEVVQNIIGGDAVVDVIR